MPQLKPILPFAAGLAFALTVVAAVERFWLIPIHDAGIDHRWQQELAQKGLAAYNPRTGEWALRTPADIAYDPLYTQPLHK